MTRDSGSDRAAVVIKDDKVLDTMSPLTKIKYDGKITTVGRVLFNNILPNKIKNSYLYAQPNQNLKQGLEHVM